MVVRRDREAKDPVGAAALGDLGREIKQDPGPAGHVVAGIADDQDVRGAGLAAGDQPAGHVTQLRRRQSLIQ
jgi:hypothetical protein